MYEFEYKSVANSTVKDIKEAHDNVMKILKAGLKKGGVSAVDARKIEPINPLLSKKYDEETQLAINMYNYQRGNLNITISIDRLNEKGLELKHFEKIIRKVQAAGLKPKFYVTGYSQFGKEKEHTEMLFSQEILTTLIALNNYLISNQIAPIKFLENDTMPQFAWTLKEVFDANQEIDSLVETIKLQNFSPFEAVIFIHHYITNKFLYKENDENPDMARSIVGVLNSDSIVCVGYAELTKAIIDKLNMPGLSAETIECIIKPKKGQNLLKKSNLEGINDEMDFAHLQNLITIDDPKYNVKGSYASDACWDTKNEEFDMGKGFGHCMFPVDDLFHLAGKTYQQVNKLSDEEALALMESDKITVPLKSMPIYRNHVGKYPPIPVETYKNCIYKVLRKAYPYATIAEINRYTRYYMNISEINAYDTFDENVKHTLALEATANSDLYFEGEEENQVISYPGLD